MSTSAQHIQSFARDKNYFLKSAQEKLFDILTERLISKTIQKYSLLHNSLGIIDETFRKILDYKYDNTEELKDIYENLCVAYRFETASNQLEIIWDGRTHEEKYAEEWAATFHVWVDELTNKTSIQKSVLNLTVFNDNTRNLTMIRNAVKGIINDHFAIKILKINGVKKVILNGKKK